jgi:hypothetical protein
MAVGSLLSIGTQGVQSGVKRANEAALDIARLGIASGEDQSDLATSLVELTVSEQLVAASAAVIKTADETLGTLIDTRA